MPDRPVRDQWNQPKENGTPLFDRKQNCQPDRSVPFMFRPTFRLLLSEVGLETGKLENRKLETRKLETRIFEKGTASRGRTRPTGLKSSGFLFPENFLPGPKHSIFVPTEIFGNLSIMASILSALE